MDSMANPSPVTGNQQLRDRINELEAENARLRCLALRYIKESIAYEVGRLWTRLGCCTKEECSRIRKSIRRGNRHLAYYEEAYHEAKHGGKR